MATKTKAADGPKWGNKVVAGGTYVVAVNGSGELRYFKGTGSAAKPFSTRARTGPGWQIRNSLS